MRIGIVSDYYRPWPGGISEHVHHEALELRRRGHHVVILTGPASPARAIHEFAVVRWGFELTYYHNGSRSRRVFGSYLWNIREQLRRLRLDLLHVHAPMDPILGMAALLASEVANVGTFHANFQPGLLMKSLSRGCGPVLRRVFERMHCRIAVSPAARQGIATLFPGSYDIVPNGVDTDRFRPDVEPVVDLDDLNTGRPIVLFVGRPDPRKGLPLLLEAFAEVTRQVPGTRLVIVGDLRARQRRRLLAATPADVRPLILCAGYVPPELLPRYYASADVVCSPAVERESQGVVLLEAMASGRPIVTFDIAGYRDLIRHGSNGWLVPQIAAAPLADALVHLLRHPEVRTALGTAGRATALQYCWRTVGSRLEERFFAAREIASKEDRAWA